MSQSQVKSLLARLFSRVRFDVRGLEHLPRQGPALIVMNHTGWEEILFALLAVPREMNVMGIRELMFLDDEKGRARIFDSAYGKRFGPMRRGLTVLLGGLLGGTLRRLLREFGFIPTSVFTETWRPTLGSNGIRDTVNALGTGSLALIFPEGGYNRDGVMTEFKAGVGLILRLLHRRGIRVPVIPAAQCTAGSISLALGNCYTPRLVFGPPLYFRPDEFLPGTFDQTVMSELQDRVAALLPRVWPDHPPQNYSMASTGLREDSRIA